MRRQSILIFLILFPFLCLPLASQVKNVTTIDTLSIITFNDFHGSFVEDGGVPGAGQLVQMVMDEKAKHPNTVVVSGGDNFSGSYYSLITKGRPLPEMFEMLGVEVSALGNHEFDWGISYLVDSAARYTPYISANITTNGSDQPEWIEPYKIVERNLKNGEIIRIAFVGLTTTETVYQTNPVNLKGLQFIHPLGAAATQTLYNLKKEGAIDMIVLLAHIGSNMRNPDRLTEENTKVLPYLDGIDAIITAHTHEVVLDKINDIPVIQVGSLGRYIGKLLFQVRNKNGINEISFICGDTIRTSAGRNKEMEVLVNHYMEKHQLDRVLTIAKDDLIHSRLVNQWDYTPVGMLVTSAYVDCFLENNKEPELNDLPVIGMNHYGGIRTNIYKGEVTMLRAGNVLPFGGDVVAYHFDGKRLKELLQEGRTNSTGYMQVSPVEMKLKGDQVDQVYWTSPDGKRMEITDSTPCIVVLDQFITAGGDGYSTSLFENYGVDSFNSQHNETTKTFIEYLSKQDFISSKTVHTPKVLAN